MTDYDAFLRSKDRVTAPSGFDPGELHPALFDYQRDVTRWALRRGRAGLFLSTGMGKTITELVWANKVAEHTGGRVLILAPIAVSSQTKREADRFGLACDLVASQADVSGPVAITNYEKLHKFDLASFAGVVCDEGGVLKSFDGKTRNALISGFVKTPYKLIGTATPAPNDHEELGNHAEFLGVMTRTEMLAEFFVHDGGDTSKWRIKGHARRAFWKWVCSWAVVLRMPSDLGYDDTKHILPPLHIREHIVASDDTQARETGLLFSLPARTLNEQRAAKRGSMNARVERVVSLVQEAKGEHFLIWCEMNDEGDALEKAIPGSVQVAGADSLEWKENAIQWFTSHYEEPCTCGVEPACVCKKLTARRPKVLISKGKIFGWGINLQGCSHMSFVGASNSYEGVYQSIRRCWRFGQKKPVYVHMVLGEAEQEILANLKRKEADAQAMIDGMAEAMRDIQRANVRGLHRETNPYDPQVKMRLPAWLRSES
jgi:hypothetical protein